MYVEYLKFRVEPQLREQFVERDREIWTAALAAVPAFEHKELWLNPEDPSELVTIVYWRDRDQWKAIPPGEPRCHRSPLPGRHGRRQL